MRMELGRGGAEAGWDAGERTRLLLAGGGNEQSGSRVRLLGPEERSGNLIMHAKNSGDRLLRKAEILGMELSKVSEPQAP